MEDLPLFRASAQAQPQEQRLIHTVTDLTQKVRGVLEPAFDQVWVRGEISNFRPAASGHVYFSLKDSNACISAALFGWGRGAKRNEKLCDGVEVLCFGKISVYPPRGSYQLIVVKVELLGAGALQAAFEELKARLSKEGLFDRKRPLPPFPMRIAVVTSPSGAAIRDMLNLFERRAPHLRITVIPAVVQGDEAPAQIIEGLRVANEHRLGDVIILARGGGSIEDLWCFNDEKLARAIADSELPVVSAVGHEIDFTISDFVADLRAPTPSAAAELVTNHWLDARTRYLESFQRLKGFIARDLSNRGTLLRHIAARLISPGDRIRVQVQKCDEIFARLERSMENRLDQRRALLEKFAGKLDALSPLKVLERGYSLVTDPENQGKIIKSVHDLKSGKRALLKFYDGEKPIQAV